MPEAVTLHSKKSSPPELWGITDTMPYHDEEYPGQSLGQSVVLFCCKGMIEGIMVLLFLWLLLQVLFTKQLEVHLQVLLLVGLVTFCLSLLLGCVLCWRKSKICPFNDPIPLPPPPHTGRTTPLVVPTQSLASPHHPQAGSSATRQPYEEIVGSVHKYPSTFSSSTPSDDGDDFSALPLSAHRFFRRASSFYKEQQPNSYLPLRRLSTPSTGPQLHKPVTPSCSGSHSSFTSIRRLGLLSKTCRWPERRCTVTGDSIYTEHSQLTSTSTLHHPEDHLPIPLQTLRYGSTGGVTNKLIPTLHFTLWFSPEKGTLSITVLSLIGATHSLADVSVMGSLAPLCPCPLQASTLCIPSTSTSPGLGLDPHTLGLNLKAGSLEELQRCVLRLAVYTQNIPSMRGSPLGKIEMKLGGEDWKAGQPIQCIKELSPSKWKVEESLTDQDAWVSRGPSCGPQIQGQILIMLQYQTPVHRIKGVVLRADNLTSLTKTLGAPVYHVVINLHHEGAVIYTKEIKGVGGANKEWNAPFLFDLPPGDVTTLPLMLEFIIMLGLVYPNSNVLGRVLIGSEAPEAGRCHWRDVCGQGQMERARWHKIQPL